MKQIFTYKLENGKCPYDIWFSKLDKANQVRIYIQKAKMYLKELNERNI